LSAKALWVACLEAILAIAGGLIRNDAMTQQLVLYPAFAFNPSTCDYDLWMGTASVETIKKYGLKADASYPLWADARKCVDGWGYRAR
jgi:hypothetical protein